MAAADELAFHSECSCDLTRPSLLPPLARISYPGPTSYHEPQSVVNPDPSHKTQP